MKDKTRKVFEQFANWATAEGNELEQHLGREMHAFLAEHEKKELWERACEAAHAELDAASRRVARGEPANLPPEATETMLRECTFQRTGKRDTLIHPKAVEDVAKRLRSAGLLHEAAELEEGVTPEATEAVAPVAREPVATEPTPVWEAPAPRRQPATPAPVEPIAPSPTTPHPP